MRGLRPILGLTLLLALFSLSLGAVNKKKNKKAKEKSDSASTSAAENPLSDARSPFKEGLFRDTDNKELPELTPQVKIDKGVFYYGTAMGTPDGKVMPQTLSDGAAPRVKTFLTAFELDIYTVTNRQFKAFAEETNYKTDAELYKWSFVLDGLTSQAVVDEVDGEKGYGRVQNALHWMAVQSANWRHPYGKDSNIKEFMDHPVVHVSYRDAEEYCSWAGGDPAIEIAKEKAAGIWKDDKDENGVVDPRKVRPSYRLPTEREWEMAARAGLINNTYPWGNDAPSNAKNNMPMFNHWPGKKFNPTDKKAIESNVAFDGYHGLAPSKHYLANDYGLYQMLGNVWEWTYGGSADKRPLRGGSFIDSIDGRFNHAIMVSTRQSNSGDSSAVNTGFRCARAGPLNIGISQRDEHVAEKLRKEQEKEIKLRQREQQEEKKREKETKSKGKKKKVGTPVTKEPEEGLMDKQERLARRRSSKKSEREADAKREADIKRARRETTDIKMEL